MSNQSPPENSTGVDFYWRPGCGFSMMLERDLLKRGIPLNKRNIWEDPEAADFVKSVANGNETVPTVSLGGRSMVNPSGEQVALLVDELAPHLVS